MTITGLGEKIRNITREFPEIRLVYLFGSQVSGQTGELSDVDLALLLASTADQSALRAAFAHAAALALATERIDVVLLDQVPIELAFAIIAEGQLLYQGDSATRVEEESLILSKYGDYLPILREQQRDILLGTNYAIRIHRYREAFGRTQGTLSSLAAIAREVSG